MPLVLSKKLTEPLRLGLDETYPLGWPQLAAFLNSADGSAIFRRFGTAHCRVLIHLQAEITGIEKALSDLDASDSSQPDKLYRLRRHEWQEGWDTAQKALLDKLRLKLSEYGISLLNSFTILGTTPYHDIKVPTDRVFPLRRYSAQRQQAASCGPRASARPRACVSLDQQYETP